MLRLEWHELWSAAVQQELESADWQMGIKLNELLVKQQLLSTK